MGRFENKIGSFVLRSVLMLISFGLGTVCVAQQTLQVVTSNGPTSGAGVPILYGVGGVPGTPSLSPLYYSQTSPYNFSSFVSLAYLPSNTVPNTYDVIAADGRGNNSIIWRFLVGVSAPPGPVTQVWPTSCECAGPQQVLKVAVDGNGTLYVLSSDSTTYSGPNPTTTELWAFPKMLASASGFASQPVLVDAYVAGVGPNGQRDYSQNNIDAGEGTEHPATYSSVQNIALRSGNGTVNSSDSKITFYNPSYCGPFGTDGSLGNGDGSIGDGTGGQFTPAAFSAAANTIATATPCPQATVVAPYYEWGVTGLSTDNLAHWIGVTDFNGEGGGNPQSALYAYTFSAPASITSASMTMNFAVDNNLGESAGNTGSPASLYNVPGLYLNGAALPGTSGLPPLNDGSAFNTQQVYTNNNIGSLFNVNGGVNNNTLYLYQYDWGVTAGLIFSTTLTVTSVNQNYDLIVAPAGVALPVQAGDVLVMFGDAGPGNRAVVADYNASSLLTFILTGQSQCNSIATCTGVNPLTVVNSNDLGLAANEAARGLAVWPKDSHVMLMTTTNVTSQTTFPIYKFTWNYANSAYQVVADPLFATNVASACTVSPCEPTTLRTGVQAGTSYAFVTAPAQVGAGSNLVTYPSQLLELIQTTGTCTSPFTLANTGLCSTASSSESNGALTGLAVQTTGPSGCLTGCNIPGGNGQVFTGTSTAINAVNALTSTTGTITDTVCIVPQDPRKICGGTNTKNSQYSATELPVSSVCPASFGSTKIPDYICGNYGPGGYGHGNGFVLIQGTAKGLDAIPGLFIKNDLNPDYWFSSTPPTCPQMGSSGMGAEFVPGVFGWAPWSGSAVEGMIPEGNDLIELTWGCGSSQGHSSGNSVVMGGGILNFAHATKELGPHPTVESYLKFAAYKYVNLVLDVAGGDIALTQKVRLEEIIVESAVFLAKGGTYYEECAANKLWSADKYVNDHGSDFFGVPGVDPNPYGRSRSRLANLVYTIFSEIAGQPPPITWPLSSAPGTACPASVYLDADGY